MSRAPTESLFVDTGGFYAAFVESDDHHTAADALFAEIQAGETFARVFTSRYVLSEFATTMLYSVGYRKAITAMETILDSETFNLLPIGHPEFMTTWKEFQRYDDQEISFVDQSSAVLARQHNVEHIFSFDSDFEILGFTLVPFEQG